VDGLWQTGQPFGGFSPSKTKPQTAQRHAVFCSGPEMSDCGGGIGVISSVQTGLSSVLSPDRKRYARCQYPAEKFLLTPGILVPVFFLQEDLAFRGDYQDQTAD
jgi:hypothetical protein